jgi:hypothetical protein
MGIAHRLGPYCACASPTKPATVTEATTNAAMRDFIIVVTPEFGMPSRAAQLSLSGIVASVAARIFHV